MLNTYNPNEIEPKWEQIWAERGVFKANDAIPKYYCLDMFPYPSANGLHVGHPEGYTATDIVSRYMRMKGFNVMHPMGWDAFGLPAENYAIKTGVDPDTSTHNNIKNFTRQIKSLGFSYDWSREVDTSSPEYYKWTQWLFLQMYEHGLAYRKLAKVNWCEHDQTVLANEQVVDGMCERCKNPVIQKNLKQWFFKTTDYADQLLNDLETIDWPEPIKLMQKNWIGKSEGAEIEFRITDGTDKMQDVTDKIIVFTTRPDTLFGVTYVVLSPEHELVSKITTSEQQQAVDQYIIATKKKNDLERTDLNKDKTGVFTGAYAINPANEKQVPIWVADYVLSTYGTGAVMAVPAHDERDWEFAKQYHLEIKPVIIPTKGTEIFTGSVTAVFREQYSSTEEYYRAVEKISNEERNNKFQNEGPYTLDGDLMNSGEFTGKNSGTAKWEITEKVGGKKVTKYRMRDWLISRQRYWGAPIPIVYDPQGEPHAVKPEHLPLLLPTDVDYVPKGTSPIGTSATYKQLAETLYGAGWYFEVDTMDTFVCSSWYYLRYCDPHNDTMFAAPEKLAQWLPVDMYVGGAEHAVLHLLYARFFHKALQDFGIIPKQVGREPFKALRNQGMILGEDHQKMSKSRGNVVNPDEIVQDFGADSMRLYEMFMGPFEDMKPWNPESIKGVRRFLEKVYKLGERVETCHGMFPPETTRLLNQTIQKVTTDIEQFHFNTAISAMMIYANHLNDASEIDPAVYEPFIIILAPFAPHMCEEIWQQLGHTDLVAQQPWPKVDATQLSDDTVKIAVQVNGKMRDTIMVPAGATEEAVKQLVDASEKVQSYVTEKQLVKFIYVPGKIVNIVVAP